MLGAVAPIAEFMAFLARGVASHAWEGPVGGFFIVFAIATPCILAAGIMTGWFLLPKVLEFGATVLWLPLYRRVDRRIWTEQFFDALKSLPLAAAAGSLTWLMYSFFDVGHHDVIFGVIGNLIGACCYVPVLIAWLRAFRRGSSSSIKPGT